MKTLIVIILFACLLKLEHLQAQELQAPKRVWGYKAISDLNYRFFTIGWDSVAGATEYRMDVAYDSAFKTILPGLFDVPPIKIKSMYEYPWFKSNTIATIMGLLPQTRHYVRVRAKNSSGTSPNSPTLIVTTASAMCIVPQIVSATDTSVTMRWRYGATIFQYSRLITCPAINPKPVYKLQYELLPPNSFFFYLIGQFNNTDSTRDKMTLTEDSVTITGLMPNSGYKFYIRDQNYSGETSLRDITLPRTLARYGSVISFYEGPLEHRLPQDRSLFYTVNNQATSVLERAVEVLDKMRKAGIHIDTAWFSPGGTLHLYGVPIPTNDDFPRTGPSSLTIKLQQPDSRVSQYGFKQGIGTWNYSDIYTYYRYAFDKETSVQQPRGIEGVDVSIEPNPSNGVTRVKYTLRERGTVSFILYDMLGRRIKEIYQGFALPGEHEQEISLQEIPEGSYYLFMRILTNNGSILTKSKMLGIFR